MVFPPFVSCFSVMLTVASSGSNAYTYICLYVYLCVCAFVCVCARVGPGLSRDTDSTRATTYGHVTRGPAHALRRYGHRVQPGFTCVTNSTEPM